MRGSRASITFSSALLAERCGSTVRPRIELRSVAACGVSAATEAGFCVSTIGGPAGCWTVTG